MIVGLGNPVYDYIKTPYISTQTRVLSGCSTNACLALTKLGEPAALVGRIGPDYESAFRADMDRFGIAYELLPTAETGGFGLVYDDTGDRTLEVLGIADPIDRFPERFREADVVFVGPILGETPPDLVTSIVQATDAPLVLDPQGLMRRIRDGRIERYRNPDLISILPLFDVVKPNEQEALILTGVNPRHDAEAAVRRLFDLMTDGERRPNHPPIAIVTIAEAGSIIYDGVRSFRIPAYRTTAKDPTGAGDTYAGGFMYQYSRTPEDLYRVGCVASAVASVMVENTGPEFPLTLPEALRRAETLLARA